MPLSKPSPELRHIALRLAVTAAALVIALAGISRIVLPKHNQDAHGPNNYEAAHGIFAETENSVDLLFLGDSETYCAITPLELWHNHGIASYISATGAQRLPLTLSMLNRVLDHQRPKVVVLETNCLFRAVTPGTVARQAANDALPVLEYHNRWKTLRPDDLTAAPFSIGTADFKGYRLKTGISAADDSSYMTPTMDSESIRSLNRWYLEQIADVCRSHDIKLVLVSTPSTVNWNMKRHNCVQQLAGELDVDYIDLNTGKNRAQIDWSTDTFDGGDHLNLQGAQKATAKLGELLQDRYYLPDHSGESAYCSWDEAYARYERVVNEGAAS